MTTWKIEGSTHGMACKGCADAASKAIGMARVTGSVGSTHTEGMHVAKVSREVKK